MESRGKNRSSSSLAPGFRFHPTDEELVRYYLRRKVCGRAFRYDAISEIDIYKAEPWDLPSKSRIQSRDLEWYFFSMLDKKYGNGSRTNRATGEGYWKTTGKDREVYHRAEVVGMKKTLVYHNGRAPKGQRTNWVMHEYRLVDAELKRLGIEQVPCYATVLCRVFQKSGSGPKNGEQYGATFVEEDWEDDELELSSKGDFAVEVDFCDDGYLDGDDLEQILASEEVPSDTAHPQVNVHSADDSNGDETTESVNNTQNILVSTDQHCESENHDYTSYYNIPAPHNNDMDEVKAVKREYIGESSKSASFEDGNFLLDEPFMDASDHLNFGDVDPNGFSNLAESDASVFGMLDEYLVDFNANDDSQQYFDYDSTLVPKDEDLVYDESLLPKNEFYEGFEQATLPSGVCNNDNENNAASQYDDQELAKYQSDFDYSFMKQASQMLGSIPAPPALAAEFPSKEAMLRLSSAAQSSSHVTAGMIQIRRNMMNLDGKNDYNCNILLSFGFSRGDDGSATLESSVRVLPGKLLSSISRGWICFIFLCVAILSMSTKFGSYIVSAN